MAERFAEVIATRTRDEWAKVFDGTDACVAPVLDIDEAPEHPHNVARGTFVERFGAVQAAPAPRFSRTPAALDRPPAFPGQHTDEVLADWGFTDDERDGLRSAGAVR
jgi:alpha-methylacyl-CoA racemase